MQNQYLHALAAKIEADDRINAAWLEGSFGRGNADRYSDLDIHLLLAPDHVEAFGANAEAWLSATHPLVLFNVLFDGKMMNALTETGLRIDLWLHAGDTITLAPGKARILADKAHAVKWEQSPPQENSGTNVRALVQQTNEFWRCIALLPSVVGRNEMITGFTGLAIETNLLIDVLLAGYGIARDRGVKNLNQFLPPNIRQEIEGSLSMGHVSVTSLAQAHLRLTRVMQQHGPIIAAKHEYAYPAELEAAVLRYVHNELALLNVDMGLNHEHMA